MPTPPPSFHDDERQGFRGPWTFLREALPGGFGAAGQQLIAAWALFALLPAWFWARHIASFAGSSALANHAGERLSARDIMELWWNGKWGQDPIGTLPILALLFSLLWALWAGWRMQAELLGRRPTVPLWLLGLGEALLIGLAPLALARWLLMAPIRGAGDLGISVFSWAAFALRPLSLSVFLTALSFQWSICRVGHLAGGGNWFRHAGHSFLRLWSYPVQWTLLALGASLLRMGLSAAVLALAWRLGGDTSGRTLLFASLQALAAAIVAWTLGWQLRLTALFTRHDAAVRAEQCRLAEAAAMPVEAAIES